MRRGRWLRRRPKCERAWRAGWVLLEARRGESVLACVADFPPRRRSVGPPLEGGEQEATVRNGCTSPNRGEGDTSELIVSPLLTRGLVQSEKVSRRGSDRSWRL